MTIPLNPGPVTVDVINKIINATNMLVAASLIEGGDVDGPASSTNNNVALFDGTTGKLLKDSGLTLSGSNTGDQTSVTGNAGTVTVADAAGDTTTFVLLGTSQTGSLSPATDAGITYNATTNALTATTFVGALTGNADTATNQTGTNSGDQLVFKTIAVAGQTDIVADTATDTLTVVAGTNITITTDATTDTLTINAAGGGGATSLDGLTDAKTNATSVFLGSTSGDAITTGANNVAVGIGAMDVSTNGSSSVAVGYNALGANIGGYSNTAIGSQAMLSNTTGANNVAVGLSALLMTNTTDDNTAVGREALTTTTGSKNTAVGSTTLLSVTTGSNNTAVGRNAGITLTTGSNNVLVGEQANVTGASASNQIAIGATATCPGDNKVQIGNTSITDVYFGDNTAKLHADGSLLTNLPAGAQQLVLLATATASASASLDFTSVITDTYTHYIVVVENLLLSTTATIGLKTSINNGTAYNRGITYQKESHTGGGTTVPTYTGGSGVSPAVIATSSPGGYSSGCILFETRASMAFFAWESTLFGANSVVDKTIAICGEYINAFQFLPSAGNFTSGKVYLYGVKNT